MYLALKKRAVSVGLMATLLVSLSLALPASTRADGATHTTIPVSTTVYVPCADELVDLAGTIHLLNHFVEDGNGGFHGTFSSHSSGLQGTGQTSGLRYVGQSRTHSVSYNSPDGAPATSSFIFVFRVIGQGPGNNSILRLHIHATTNANGETTAQVSQFENSCD